MSDNHASSKKPADGESRASNGKAPPNTELEQQIETRQRRKLKALREGEQSPWFGLGMFGLVGWSVALPTLLGILIGAWIDHRWPSRISWTLMLLFAGVIVGFANAWYWMRRESESRE